MNKKVYQTLLFIFLAASFLAGSKAICKASSRPANLLQKADSCRKTLYSSEKKKKYRHNWLGCIRQYERIYALYPDSDQAPWAVYHSARLYTDLYRYSGSARYLEDAIGLYKRLVDKYFGHFLADDAQYRIGEIFYTYKKDVGRAYVEFLKVEVKFPSGDMKGKAQKMLDKLAVILSKREKNGEKGANDASGPKLVSVKDIRYWSTPNYTRVVVDLDNRVEYEYHLLKADPKVNKPRRLYLDLKNARVTSEIDHTITIKDDLLKRARAGQFTEDTVRVVLDMESIGQYKVFPLYDPFRIVLDVRKSEGTETEGAQGLALKKRGPEKGIKKAKGTDRTVSLARQLGLNVSRVVIDPGHGGKDPGCRVRGGIEEKDITLKIAKLLAKKLEQELGCKVFLTRDKDTYLPLERRTAIANMKKADLFISLHVNAHRSSRIHGLETYFLNIATDEGAVMVAARENATSQKNISDLQLILNDLMLNTKILESSRLAHRIQKGMVSGLERDYSSVRDLGVKQAPFYVLIGAEMPAVLIEVGFLTNRMDRKMLLSKRYQEKVAEGIGKGIKDYIASIEKVYQGG